MQAKKQIQYSFLISIFLHVIFIFFAGNLQLSANFLQDIKSKKYFNIKSLNRDIPKRNISRQRSLIHVNSLKFVQPMSSKLQKEIDSEIKKLSKEELQFTKNQKVALIDNYNKDIYELFKKRDEDFNSLKKRVDRKTRKDLVEVSPMTSKDSFEKSSSLLVDKQMSRDFFDKMPGFTPKNIGTSFGPPEKSSQGGSAAGYSKAIKRKADFTDLNEYIVYRIFTYEDKKDKQKYYKISMRVGKDGINLTTAPKEIVFLIDCSSSIGEERFEQFKTGIQYCINNLNKHDVFNIGAFKRRVLWFSPTSIEPIPRNIEKAEKFINELYVKQKTDAYNALYKSIKREQTKTPSYIIFFSDGLPTYGETDARKIVNNISDLNDGQRPIFTVSGGMGVNRYFLDFISYKNRGWTEYTNRTAAIDNHIKAMYDKIRYPLIQNLKYNVSGLNVNKIFPKLLPDFFRDTEFTLYGKYNDEDEFSLRLFGDMNGNKNEFIISGFLKDAEEGGEEIARNWAFNKIYYLIGLLKYNKNNASIIKEINSLCKKFDIKTPYSEDIKK